MTHYKGYRIASARLPGWDYTAGWYFITVCTHQRRPLLSAVAGEAVDISPIGAIVAEEWQRTPAVRPNVTIDAWVAMPDHFHGIIAIYPDADNDGDDGDVETPRRGVSTSSPSSPRRSILRAGSLGAIVGQWKSVSTKRIRAAGYADFAWQSRFYDVIIRDITMLDRVRRYIDDNPRRYSADRARPAGAWM